MLFRSLKYLASLDMSSGIFSIIIPLLFLVIDFSVFISANLLIKQNRFAAYVCYVQTPVRLFIGYSSIPFVNSYIANNGDIIPTIVVGIEIIKIITVILWHVFVIKKSNIEFSLSSLFQVVFRRNFVIALFLLTENMKFLVNISLQYFHNTLLFNYVFEIGRAHV